MRWSLTITTPPAADALDVETDLRTHCRCDGAGNDAELRRLLASAVDWLEPITARTLIATVYAVALDSFPGERLDRRCSPAWDGPDRYAIFLPRGPVAAGGVASIKYDDTNGVEQTLAGSAYRVDTSSAICRITPAHSYAWPATRNQTGAVRVAFTAGHGASYAAVPASAQQVLRLVVGQMFRFHEPIVTGTIVASLPRTLESMLARITLHFPTFAPASAA